MGRLRWHRESAEVEKNTMRLLGEQGLPIRGRCLRVFVYHRAQTWRSCLETHLRCTDPQGCIVILLNGLGVMCKALSMRCPALRRVDVLPSTISGVLPTTTVVCSIE